MNKYNVMILVLCVSAMLLAALLIGSYATQPVQAGSVSIRSGGGDYILGTVSVSNSIDVVTVIDVAAQHMILYAPDKNGNRIEVNNELDLRRAFPDRR